MTMRIHVLIAAGLLSVSLAAPASAQERPAGLAFAGCWAPADGLSARNRICLTPTASAIVEFTSITADGNATVSMLSLDGKRIEVRGETCTGWEEGRLTSDGERLLVNAEITCGTDPKQLRTTAFTIAPSGHLLQMTGSGLSQVATTQLRIFAPVESYADIPPATRELLMPYLVDAERTRLDVRAHTVSASDLVEFERLGVATPIIDLIVAASYPKSFVIDGASGGVTGTVDQGQSARQAAFAANPFGYMNGYPMLSMYDWQMMYECSRIGIGCPLGYNMYGYGYGSRYGWGGVGGWGGWGGYGVPGYGIPVVVRPVSPPSETAGTSGGRAVRGRGYTQSGNGSTGGGTATPRTTVGTTSSTSTVQGSGGSSGSSGSAGASSGAAAPRTAKPRP
jgi:hypothetical protein